MRGGGWPGLSFARLRGKTAVEWTGRGEIGVVHCVRALCACGRTNPQGLGARATRNNKREVPQGRRVVGSLAEKEGKTVRHPLWEVLRAQGGWEDRYSLRTLAGSEGGWPGVLHQHWCLCREVAGQACKNEPGWYRVEHQGSEMHCSVLGCCSP